MKVSCNLTINSYWEITENKYSLGCAIAAIFPTSRDDLKGSSVMSAVLLVDLKFQVKLVRTQGEVWEVADVQNTKTLPVPSSLKRVRHCLVHLLVQ